MGARDGHRVSTDGDYLIDTDIAIEALRKRDRRLIEQMRAQPAVALSTVSLYELRFGAARSSNPGQNDGAIDQLASVLTVIDFTPDAATEAGLVRAELAGKGTPIGPYDLMIAGQARAASLTLVTRNQREFRRVRGLSVEKW